MKIWDMSVLSAQIALTAETIAPEFNPIIQLCAVTMFAAAFFLQKNWLSLPRTPDCLSPPPILSRLTVKSILNTVHDYSGSQSLKQLFLFVTSHFKNISLVIAAKIGTGFKKSLLRSLVCLFLGNSADKLGKRGKWGKDTYKGEGNDLPCSWSLEDGFKCGIFSEVCPGGRNH
jgi:hypothetical protein